VDPARFLEWWYLDEGKRFGLAGELPAAQGAIVARTIERLAETTPVMPGEAEEDVFLPARRADALVRLCSGRIADDPDPDRATVVVHVQAAGAGQDLAQRGRLIGGGQIERGPALAPQTLERLLCDARSGPWSRTDPVT
jgi:hypothetical protein